MEETTIKSIKGHKRKLQLVKNSFLKVLRYIFLYFANRLEFGLDMHKTFNLVLIGLVWFEWWFYFEGFWVYVLPVFIEFFSVLFQFLEIKITQIFIKS